MDVQNVGLTVLRIVAVVGVRKNSFVIVEGQGIVNMLSTSEGHFKEVQDIQALLHTVYYKNVDY